MFRVLVYISWTSPEWYGNILSEWLEWYWRLKQSFYDFILLIFFCRFLEKGLGVNVTALATGKTETKIYFGVPASANNWYANNFVFASMVKLYSRHKKNCRIISEVVLFTKNKFKNESKWPPIVLWGTGSLLLRFAVYA